MHSFLRVSYCERDQTCELHFLSKAITETDAACRVLIAQMACLLPAFTSDDRKQLLAVSKEQIARVRPLVFNVLSIIVILSGVASIYRTPTAAIQPYRPGPRIIRAGIWTVHFGMDNEGRDSQRAMRDLIR